MAASDTLPNTETPQPSLVSAPVSTALSEHPLGPPTATRNRLPDERRSITHKFRIGSHEGYFTVGLYPSGEPGELFIRMAKEGSTISGLLDSFAQAVSLGLQHGVPIKLFCNKLICTRFDPCGFTGNEKIRYAKSIMDYIFYWLQQRFVPGAPIEAEALPFGDAADPVSTQTLAPPFVDDGPACTICGTLTRKAGSCYYCPQCGHSSGCS